MSKGQCETRGVIREEQSMVWYRWVPHVIKKRKQHPLSWSTTIIQHQINAFILRTGSCGIYTVHLVLKPRIISKNRTCILSTEIWRSLRKVLFELAWEYTARACRIQPTALTHRMVNMLATMTSGERSSLEVSMGFRSSQPHLMAKKKTRRRSLRWCRPTG